MDAPLVNLVLVQESYPSRNFKSEFIFNIYLGFSLKKKTRMPDKMCGKDKQYESSKKVDT